MRPRSNPMTNKQAYAGLLDTLRGAGRGLCTEDLTGYVPRGVSAATCIEAAEAISSLLKALEPFAKMADYLDNTAKRRDAIYCGGDPGILAEVTQADYHRARA